MKSLKTYIAENFLNIHYSDLTYNTGELRLITEKGIDKIIDKHSKTVMLFCQRAETAATLVYPRT